MVSCDKDFRTDWKILSRTYQTRTHLGLDGWDSLKPTDPACDDAAFAIIIENFDEDNSNLLELRRQKIEWCGDRIEIIPMHKTGLNLGM